MGKKWQVRLQDGTKKIVDHGLIMCDSFLNLIPIYMNTKESYLKENEI
jgi:hypothetical protein